MATFRLLHASDFHLASTPFRAGAITAGWVTKIKPKKLSRPWLQISHDPNVARAFAAFAYGVSEETDALIITGDLATTGRRVDLNTALSFLTNPAVSGTPLTSTGEPTLSTYDARRRLDILPGNHDRYRSAALLYRPGGTVFDQVFAGRHWRNKQSTSDGVALRKGNVVLHVVKADFTLVKRDSGKGYYYLPGWFGQGRVRHSVLNNLIIRTQTARDYIEEQGLIPFTIWAIHFDPFSTDETLKLLHSERLISAASELDVTTILCGHTHESKIKPLSDATTIFACGTTCQANSQQNDCQILRIDVAEDGDLPLRADVKTTWYRYNDMVGRFVALMER